MPLDPVILTLMIEQSIRTTFIVDLATPVPRRWTNYPGGIHVPSILGTLTLISGGTAYVTPPVVTIAGGGGQGAEAIAILTGGAVTSLVLISRGWGYTSAPAVSFAGGGGSGAAATATIGVTFPYADVAFSPVSESADGTSVISGSITILNTDNAATPLVTDSTNVGVPVAIQKVWRDDSDAVVATEIWLEGYTGRPAFADEHVVIDCHADIGRSGDSPVTEWSEVLHSHTPPDESNASDFMNI